MAHIKIEMGKMDSTWGTVELLENGDFVFEGPDAKAMREYMDEVIQLRKPRGGEETLRKFMDAFSHGSYWFRDLTAPLSMTVGEGESVLGTIGWDGEQYVVKGRAIPTKELAKAIPSIEHYSGLSGRALVEALPEYFKDGDKWAKLER